MGLLNSDIEKLMLDFITWKEEEDKVLLGILEEVTDNEFLCDALAAVDLDLL